MKNLKIGRKEYKIEYSFDAAEYKECVDKAFKMVSGGYMAKHGHFDENNKVTGLGVLVDGTADMISDLPIIIPSFLYAGLLEHNPVEDEKAAKSLFRQFVKENPDDERASYYGMYDYLRKCMEEDGFFKLTGLEKMISEMNAAVVDQVKEEAAQKSAKIPTDHKKKSTSTK